MWERSAFPRRFRRRLKRADREYLNGLLTECGSGTRIVQSRPHDISVRLAAEEVDGRERHFTQHPKHPTSLNKTTRARRRSRLFGVKERVRPCLQGVLYSGGRLGEKKREKEREGSRTVTGGSGDGGGDGGGGGRVYACGELKVFRDTRRSVFQALWASQGSLRTSR